MDQLFHNLDELLKRDMNDCLSKQLNGLLDDNAQIYQVGPRNQRESVHFEVGEDFRKNVEYKTVKEGYFRRPFAQKSHSALVHKPLTLQHKSIRSRNGMSSAPPTDVFSSKKQVTPPPTPPTPSRSTTNETKRQLNFERLPLPLEADGCDMLPSNGWWRTEADSAGSSDSETDSEVISEAKSSACFNLETKNDESTQLCSLNERRSSKSCRSSFSSAVSEFSNDESKTQAQDSSSPSPPSEIQEKQFGELSGEMETSPFFHLTSRPGSESELMNETYLEPRPPQPTPDLDDKTCFENKLLSCFRRSTSLISTAEMFDDDLKLDYKELFHHRFYNTTSRINYNNFAIFKHNYSHPDQGPIIREDSFQRCFDKCRKITCVFPKVNESKDRSKNSKAIPVILQKRAFQSRPNTAEVPVKLRLTQRGSAFTKFTKTTEEIGPDERVLPTTLNKSAEASYSVMTPYMANVVWSVMDDEKVV